MIHFLKAYKLSAVFAEKNSPRNLGGLGRDIIQCSPNYGWEVTLLCHSAD